jgi:hypothetical protein
MYKNSGQIVEFVRTLKLCTEAMKTEALTRTCISRPTVYNVGHFSLVGMGCLSGGRAGGQAGEQWRPKGVLGLWNVSDQKRLGGCMSARPA